MAVSNAQNSIQNDDQKQEVEAFWQTASCGEAYAKGDDFLAQINAQATERYVLEPYLAPFAKFAEATGKDVLEIGVGMGADHAEWAKHNPASLNGADLTMRAVGWTAKRFTALNLISILEQADAENLPYADASFDIVYSWGVLHHSPNTGQAFSEVQRVLRQGGVGRMMVYHTYSLTGFMLWTKYALAQGKPFTSLKTIYANHLESPHTKAYTKKEAHTLLVQAGFAPEQIDIHIQLNHGDLLQGSVGQKHNSRALDCIKKVWPRSLIKTCFPFLGLYLMIEVKK